MVLYQSVLYKLVLQPSSVCNTHYHNDNKARKTLIRVGKAFIRYPLLPTGTVGAVEPPVVVAGAPPVGNVVFQLRDEPAADSAAVVAATGILSVALHYISYKIDLKTLRNVETMNN